MKLRMLRELEAYSLEDLMDIFQMDSDYIQSI